jgi:hypothetical protein
MEKARGRISPDSYDIKRAHNNQYCCNVCSGMIRLSEQTFKPESQDKEKMPTLGSQNVIRIAAALISTGALINEFCKIAATRTVSRRREA